jgi:molybdopterin molybdotransferase
VSCLCAYDFFAGRLIRRLCGRPTAWPYPAVSLPLARKVVSELGRVDYLRVRVVGGRVEPMTSRGASVLSTATRADGFVVVPKDVEGWPEGSVVEVRLYDPPA